MSALPSKLPRLLSFGRKPDTSSDAARVAQLKFTIVHLGEALDKALSASETKGTDSPKVAQLKSDLVNAKTELALLEAKVGGIEAAPAPAQTISDADTFDTDELDRSQQSRRDNNRLEQERRIVASVDACAELARSLMAAKLSARC